MRKQADGQFMTKQPVGAYLDNVYLEDRDHNAIQFIGAGTSNGYILGNWEGRAGAWNNTKEHTLKWSMEFDEAFVIYVRVMTKNGARYIYYTSSNESYGKNNNYIHIGLGSESSNGIWQDFSRDLSDDLKKYEPNNELIAVNAFLIRGNGFVDDVELIEERENSNIVHGGKPDKSGEGSYYKWNDANAVRGLVFDAHQDFTLKSVKVYNQQGQSATRIFTLYNASGEALVSESIYVKEGEQRIHLNMSVPKGNGYKLMADIHKGLYKNNNAKGYPYKIGNVLSIRSSDLENSNYYFFYDWEIEADAGATPLPKYKGYYPTNEELNYNHVKHVNSDNFCREINNALEKTLIILDNGVYPSGCSIKRKQYLTIKGQSKEGVKFTTKYWSWQLWNSHHINILNFNVVNGGIAKLNGYIETSHVYFGNIHGEGGHSSESSNFFTGPRSHDVTVDNVVLTKGYSDYGYGWYALGYHLSLSNSHMYNNQHSGIIIRGHWPLNHNEINEYDHNIDVRNILNQVKDIGTDDWTHHVINNTFGKQLQNSRDSSREANMAFYIGWGDANGDESYLPPKNVLIEKNNFSQAYGNSGSISVSAHYGFPQGASGNSMIHEGRAVIRGTVIKNNSTDQSILRESGSVNTNLIRLENNE